MADEVVKEGNKLPTETEPTKAAVKFYFPKHKKWSFRTAGISVKAVNHIYVLDPNNPNYDKILVFLRNRPEYGSKFIELEGNGSEGETNRAKLINQIINLDVDQLRRVCGGKPEYGMLTTKGELIDLYLSQQEEE
jgi:hypothetical protein